MKVVHSCTSDSFSGLEAYVLELASWQYRSGFDVELFCREGSPLDERARVAGIPVWTIGAREKPGLRLWKRVYRGWRERLRLGEAVLHMHAGGEPRYHFPVLARNPRRLIKTILHYHIWINHKKTDPWHRALFLGIDEVWTSSETARAHLSTLLPIPRTRIRVVPYGRDVGALTSAPAGEWRRDVRSRLKLAESDVLGLCVSRLEPIKGVGELFDAFERAAPKHPSAHLAIIGDASPSNPEAARFAAGLKKRHAALPESVRERLHLLGFVSPCEPYMAAADFYVLPTYEECMSLAMLDAAILGLPILGTNSGGTPSVARPGETGLLVPPRDSAALAVALEQLYGAPELCRRLGAAARQLGRGFDREEIFRRIWEWYGARVPATIER
ncbi:MAG: glycosyltransferase family 4 protein [Deltaproteobacteria bacterium]|nr:glycosyltransferase family 4 protein [Deltaproteobacteria bacterium]